MLDWFLSDNSKNAKSGEVREKIQNKAFVRLYFSKVAEYGIQRHMDEFYSLYRAFLISYAIFILTNTLFRLFPLTTPNLAFLELSDKNWSTIHKYWPTDENLGSVERLKSVLSAEEVFKPEK